MTLWDGKLHKWSEILAKNDPAVNWWLDCPRPIQLTGDSNKEGGLKFIVMQL